MFTQGIGLSLNKLILHKIFNLFQRNLINPRLSLSQPSFLNRMRFNSQNHFHNKYRWLHNVFIVIYLLPKIFVVTMFYDVECCDTVTLSKINSNTSAYFVHCQSDYSTQQVNVVFFYHFFFFCTYHILSLKLQRNNYYRIIVMITGKKKIILDRASRVTATVGYNFCTACASGGLKGHKYYRQNKRL